MRLMQDTSARTAVRVISARSAASVRGMSAAALQMRRGGAGAAISFATRRAESAVSNRRLPQNVRPPAAAAAVRVARNQTPRYDREDRFDRTDHAIDI
jgi:hypothetical protein